MRVALRIAAVMCSTGLSAIVSAVLWIFSTMDAAEIFSVMCVTFFASMLIEIIAINNAEEKSHGEDK